MNGKMEAIVGAKISEFRRKIRRVREMARTVPNKIVVEVETRTDKFQRRMGKIANMINSMNTVMGNMGKGSMIALSPSLVPILAVTVGLIASLGPMIAIMAASTFALATAFGVAGAAALGFGAAAIPTIKKLFEENAKLTEQQKAAKKEYEKTAKIWNKLVKKMEPAILKSFGYAMEIAGKILKALEPMFIRTAEVAAVMMKQLNRHVDSDQFQSFLKMLNDYGPTLFASLGKAFGYMMQGFLNMMVAFAPLAAETAGGFTKMMKGFSDWAEGLNSSTAFQSFVQYIQENMPKVKNIFRDAIAGSIYMFAAFGPLAADMMTGLQDMMARFKEWARTLSENPAFQEFIAYIRENAPKVLELVGNLIDFLLELGKGLAPMGSQILDVVNSILSWTNAMMKNHPWIGKIIAVVIVIIGVLMAVVPAVIGIVTAFSSAVGLIIGAVIAIAIAIIAYWEDIKKAVGKAVIVVYTTIYKAFNRVVAFLKGLSRTFFKAGAGLIKQVISGIASMVGGLVKKVKDIAGKIRDFLPFSPAKEGPLSDLDRLDFGGPITDSIRKARHRVNSAMSRLMTEARVDPQVSFGLNGGDLGRMKHDISTEVSNFEVPDPVINVYNQWDGEKVVSYVEKGNAKRTRITDGFYGK